MRHYNTTPVRVRHLQIGDQIVDPETAHLLTIDAIDTARTKAALYFEGQREPMRLGLDDVVHALGDWTCEDCGRAGTGEHWSATDCNRGGRLVLHRACCEANPGPDYTPGGAP